MTTRLTLLAFLLLAASCSSGGGTSDGQDIMDSSGPEETSVSDLPFSDGKDDASGEDAATDTTPDLLLDVPADQNEDLAVSETVEPTDIEQDLCAPDCENKECGDDGCGASCGDCGLGLECTEIGLCASVDPPDCEGKECGPDGMGGSCGACEAEETCSAQGRCVPNTASWLILIFLNGDNDLEDAAISDLQEMKSAPSNDAVRVIVQMDTLAGTTRRVEITAGTAELIEELGELDMSDWNVLAQFGAWGVQSFPADHRALVLWDHGDGWRSGKAGASPLVKAFSFDDSGDAGELSISKGEYAQAMDAIQAAMGGGKFDLVGFDACLMGMWEVAEATAPYADYVLFSEETEPDGGWDYEAILGTLAGDPNVTVQGIGEAAITSYHNSGSDFSTLSLVDLSALPVLRTAIQEMSALLLEHPELAGQVSSARSQSQKFDSEWGSDSAYVDLKDFATHLLQFASIPGELAQACSQVSEGVSQAVLFSLVQWGYSGAYGLSFYFPTPGSCSDQRYSTGAGALWTGLSSWDEYLTLDQPEVCAQWTCDPSYYDVGDGCDCDCGAWDPDCNDPWQEVYNCEDGETCVDPGVCA